MFEYLVLALCTLTVIPILTGGENVLRCHVCNSHLDADCDSEPPSELHKRQCEPGRNVCRRTTQSVEIKMSMMSSQYDERVIRECGKDNSIYSNVCYKRAGLGVKQRVCSCNSGDFCV